MPDNEEKFIEYIEHPNGTKYTIKDKYAIKSVNNTTPDEDGNVDIDLSAKQDKLTSDNAGANIIIAEDEEGKVTISATGSLTEVTWGGITGTLDDQTDLSTALNNKQSKLTEGANIHISEDNVISADAGVDTNVIQEEELLEFIGGGSGGSKSSGWQIGDIGYALYVDETKGTRRRLNGSVIAKNTNTQQFFDYLNGLQTSAPSLFTTEDNWQSELTLSKLGQCGKFVLNENEVRLPKVVNINGLQDLTQAGVRVDESLPNITGDFSITRAAPNSSNGAFTYTTGYGYGEGNRADYGSGDVTFDASRSSSTYQDGAPVQQEAIQYPFFIQIAVTSEVIEPITNSLELNNAHSFGDSKYTDIELNNISWLKSEGQWNSKAIYPDYFNWVLTNATNGVDRFKFSTDEYNDYDWVVNSGNETFRLPLKSKLAGGKAVVGNGVALGIAQTNNGKDLGNLITWYGTDWRLHYATTSVMSEAPFGGSVPIGVTTDSTKSGIETDTTGLYLYFYVGETVQNANLIDAGRIQEQFAGLITVVETFRDGTEGYRIWSDGYCEQWGTSATSYSTVVTLLKPYVDTNYAVTAVGLYRGLNEAIWIPAKTNNSISLYCRYGDSYVSWTTKGYLAEGEY